MNGYTKAAVVGVAFYLSGAALIDGSELVRHPEWAAIMVLAGSLLGVATHRILQAK